jgi:hypothetical protein
MKKQQWTLIAFIVIVAIISNRGVVAQATEEKSCYAKYTAFLTESNKEYDTCVKEVLEFGKLCDWWDLFCGLTFINAMNSCKVDWASDAIQSGFDYLSCMTIDKIIKD